MRSDECVGIAYSGSITHSTSATGGLCLCLYGIHTNTDTEGAAGTALLWHHTYREPILLGSPHLRRVFAPFLLSSLFLFKSKTEIQCTGHGVELSFTGFLRAENEI